jgi:LysM repeat protein
MDRVCPFLAIASDARTVVDGFDADHRCHAERPAAEVDRQTQLTLCSTEAHRGCATYAAAVKRHAATLAAPPPAPDAIIVRTRLVLEPGPTRSLGTLAGPRVRRYGVAGVLAAVGVGAVVTGTAGGLANLVGDQPGSRVVPAVGGMPNGSLPATPTLTPPLLPSVSPGSMAASATAVASASPTAVPSAAPQPTDGARTYIVVAGDTLGDIASAFGVSVSALMQANGLGSDTITIGQVLVIP